MARQGGSSTLRRIPSRELTEELENTLRIEGGRVLAALVRLTRDFQLAEDSLQEASIQALRDWSDRVPDNPAAWLMTVARNKALDRLRREVARGPKEKEAMRLLDAPSDEVSDGTDDRLRLFFTACHPALSPEARVSLALRTLGGMTTPEIARAFLVAEPTMGQRISRAKRKIAVAGIPYRVPDDHELPERLPAVLAALYLIFTTGHHAPSAALDARVDLAQEGIRLGRLLHELMPDEPECTGLLALMLATHARSGARLTESGSIVLLADQDRSRWDHARIEEASRLVESALRRRSPGPYQIQSAIACLHGEADSFDETDWGQIVELYRLLEQFLPTPVVRVNRAVAEAQLGGPSLGLSLLETVRGVENWHFYWSVRADFLRREGNVSEAAVCYRRALACQPNETDRNFLMQRLSELGYGDGLGADDEAAIG